MKQPIGLPAILGVAILGVAILGYASPVADGQVVFVPLDGAPRTSDSPGSSSLKIASCVDTADGLLLTGNVASTEPIVTVGVWPAAGASSGVRSGRSFATAAGILPEGEPGDFEVLLPWGSRESNFALVKPDPVPGLVKLGEELVCPSAP